MKKFITILICVYSVISFADNGQAGINFIFGIPQGEFRDNIDRLGYGIGGRLVYLPNDIFAIGGALGILAYGNEVREEPFSYTIPDVTVRVTTTNNFFFGHIIAQVAAPMGYVKPYIEGHFGFNYLWTETSIENMGSSDDDNEIASSTNFDDIVFCYGGGGGLMVKVYEEKHKTNIIHHKKSKGDLNKVYIDIKAIYTLGGTAEYLKEGSVHQGESGTVEYDVSKSKTDLLTVQVGLVFEF
ncbi:hypothetical protein J7L68_00130 [bacterium]|nr:hypothetical protein [bacterium]